MLEIWNSLPPEFRLPDPEAHVTVWRGDKISRLATGMSCRLQGCDSERVVLQASRNGPKSLLNLVDRQTGAAPDSPLISVATDLRMAQLYARPDEEETIFEVSIPAHRIVRDPGSIGAPRWPQDSELFVVGAIKPSNLKRFKSNNDNRAASELAFTDDGVTWVANALSNPRTFPDTILPNPLGVWEEVNSSVGSLE